MDDVEIDKSNRLRNKLFTSAYHLAVRSSHEKKIKSALDLITYCSMFLVMGLFLTVLIYLRELYDIDLVLEKSIVLYLSVVILYVVVAKIIRVVFSSSQVIEIKSKEKFLIYTIPFIIIVFWVHSGIRFFS